MTYLFPYAGMERPPKPPKRYVSPKRTGSATDVPLPNTFSRMEGVPPSLQQLLLDVCEEHGVTPADVCGADSRKHVVQARRVFCIRAKEATGASYTKIGRAIKKDHTCVIYFVRQGRDGYPLDPVLTREKSPPVIVNRKVAITELTELELTYLRMAEMGLPRAEIAKRMGKSKEAVDHYQKRINKKRRMRMQEDNQ